MPDNIQHRHLHTDKRCFTLEDTAHWPTLPYSEVPNQAEVLRAVDWAPWQALRVWMKGESLSARLGDILSEMSVTFSSGLLGVSIQMHCVLS